MSLRKRGSTWWIDLVSPNGERLRRSTGIGNKAQAQEYHDKLKVELWRQSTLGERAQYTWDEAVVRWLTEASHKASLKDDKGHLRWLDQYLRGKPLTSISRALIDQIWRVKKASGVSNATANRTIQVIRAILRRAALEWEWLDKAPYVRLSPEPKRRVRWLTRNEADRLLAELPPHLADMAAFSLATGLRQANVTGLQWSQLDLARRVAWIHPDQAKARKAISVPLNAEAVVLIRKQLGRHSTHVFSYEGQRITQVSTKAWYKALERAGIEDFRWHDLRHTWASWHVQQGTPSHVLQELGGWETPEMVRRYAHLACAHLAPYAERLCALRVVESSAYGTNTAQPDT